MFRAVQLYLRVNERLPCGSTTLAPVGRLHPLKGQCLLLYIVYYTKDKYKQTSQMVYLGGAINENADITPEIERRIQLVWVHQKA